MRGSNEAARAHNVAAPLSDRLPRTVKEFLATEVSGAVVLLAATIAALIWANSPWRATYESLWHTHVELSLGSHVFEMSLLHVVNDGLMVLFFFIVGLEIKRELVVGDLRDPRVAALPACAAAGGMIVPALIYIALNAGGDHSAGWGIPMATDIAFAIGVLAALGSRVSSGAKLFLLTLAIVDDIGAIVVIAVFYSSKLDVWILVAAVAVFVVIGAVRRLGITSLSVYIPLGIAAWFLTYQSGVHATIAGVVLGLMTPARPMTGAHVAREWAEDLDDEPTAEQVQAMAAIAKSSVSVAERIAYRVHPFTSLLIVPIFAFANAGVRLDVASLTHAGSLEVALGVLVGLVVGKIVGISAFTWVAVRVGLGRLPDGVRWRQLLGLSAVAGIGFTVSLFIADLAFADAPDAQSAAKTGVLIASTLAAIVGVLILVRRPPSEEEVLAPTGSNAIH